ncbi:MAG: OsmC family protein [Microbacteriaceae bacterium]
MPDSLDASADRATVRVWARSLAGMQKEVLVRPAPDAPLWRLVSDEGPYLDGYDEGPFPLAHMTTGLVAAYTDELLTLARGRGIELLDLTVTLHSYYTMEGSALRGTMVGGALPPVLEVEAETTLDEDALATLVADAVRAAPVNGLLRAPLESLFTLTTNGAELSPDRVARLADSVPTDPGALFEKLEVAEVPSEPLVTMLVPADKVEGDGGVSSSFAETQSRTLHVWGECRIREDGTKEIVQRLLNPKGSSFRFLSDELPANGGKGLAPDAASYVAAGIAFCFMTQIGRYARITHKDLADYRLVQDLRISRGSSADGANGHGSAEPVETHLFLETSEGEDFARQVLDMSEQTCFLHALLRTPLEPQVRVVARSTAANANSLAADPR